MLSSSAQMRPTSSAKRSSSCSSGMPSSSAGLANTRATSTKNKPEETFLQRPRNEHEAPFNPIRCAREYSVLKTACPALCNALNPESIRETIRHLVGGGTAHIGIILSNILPQLSEQCRAHRGHSGRG